jgi:hypothetical protein
MFAATLTIFAMGKSPEFLQLVLLIGVPSVRMSLLSSTQEMYGCVLVPCDQHDQQGTGHN